MEFVYVAMRMSIPSGGSQKVTIPITILREIWGKSGEEIEAEGFPICFIKQDDRVLIELPERVVSSRDYPDKLINKVREEWLSYQRRLIARKYNKLCMDLAQGKISEWDFDRLLNKFKEEFKKMIRIYKATFTERELHFIARGDLIQLISMISVEDEQEKEENFLLILEEVQKLKEENTKIKDTLSQLEQNFNKGKISKRMYSVLKERFLGRLTLIENRVNKLKEVICES